MNITTKFNIGDKPVFSMNSRLFRRKIFKISVTIEEGKIETFYTLDNFNIPSYYQPDPMIGPAPRDLVLKESQVFEDINDFVNNIKIL